MLPEWRKLSPLMTRGSSGPSFLPDGWEGLDRKTRGLPASVTGQPTAPGVCSPEKVSVSAAITTLITLDLTIFRPGQPLWDVFGSSRCSFNVPGSSPARAWSAARAEVALA